MATGAGKTSAAHMDHPPPLPKKPSVVFAQGGGPLPIPSRGMRKPPPAVPARFTPAAATSLTTECNKRMVSTSSLDNTEVLVSVNGINKEAPEIEETRETSRLWLNHGIGRWTLNHDGVEQDALERSSGQEETTSNVYSNITKSGGSTNGTMARLSKASPCEMSGRQAEGNDLKNHIGKISDTCIFQPGSRGLEAGYAKSISNSTKVVPEIFNGDASNLTKKVAKMNLTRWDDIVESRIKENEDDSSNSSDSVVDSQTFKQSQKNPFLADLNLNGDSETGSKKLKFSNGFSFFVDSSLTSDV